MRKEQLPQLGKDWNGRLEAWIAAVTCDEGPPEHIQSWSFPTSELRDEYLANVINRDESEVLALLRLFLPAPSSYRMDQDAVARLLDKVGLDVGSQPRSERDRRLLLWLRGEQLPHPGVRWAIDLLPSFPRHAIAAIEAYLIADWLYLPDGPIDGLDDAKALIRARYIGLPKNAEAARQGFYDFTPRQFEILVHRLYERMDYESTLTPPGKDGGRDVVAVRRAPGKQETLHIECKLHTGAVGVVVVRELLGTVSNEKVNKGVVVSASRFDRGAHDFAGGNPRLELIDGREFVILLNEYLGSDWTSRLDWLLSPRVGPV